jgi:hypothetical protein
MTMLGKRAIAMQARYAVAHSARRRAALSGQGQRSSCATAMRNTVTSSKVRPTIDSAVGTPSRDRPDGTLSTGHRLAMLNGSVIAGNPVTMGEMTRHVPDAGSYTPVTILIQELPDGGTRVAYDSVTSEIAPYRDAAAAQVAERLDAEVLGLLRQVTGVPAPGTP